MVDFQIIHAIINRVRLIIFRFPGRKPGFTTRNQADPLSVQSELRRNAETEGHAAVFGLSAGETSNGHWKGWFYARRVGAAENQNPRRRRLPGHDDSHTRRHLGARRRFGHKSPSFPQQNYLYGIGTRVGEHHRRGYVKAPRKHLKAYSSSPAFFRAKYALTQSAEER